MIAYYRTSRGGVMGYNDLRCPVTAERVSGCRSFVKTLAGSTSVFDKAVRHRRLVTG